MKKVSHLFQNRSIGKNFEFIFHKTLKKESKNSHEISQLKQTSKKRVNSFRIGSKDYVFDLKKRGTE